MGGRTRAVATVRTTRSVGGCSDRRKRWEGVRRRRCQRRHRGGGQRRATRNDVRGDVMVGNEEARHDQINLAQRVGFP